MSEKISLEVTKFKSKPKKPLVVDVSDKKSKKENLRIVVLDSLNLPIGYVEDGRLYTNRGEVIAEVKETITFKELRDTLLRKLGHLV